MIGHGVELLQLMDISQGLGFSVGRDFLCLNDIERNSLQISTMDDRTPLCATSSNEPQMGLKIQSPPSSSSVNIRLWRPAAQRNLRNQWSKLASLWHDWLSASSTARSHGTSLVNSFLSQRYMDKMELGVLSEMPDIRKKACLKLSKQQDLQRNELLSSYKDMVGIVVHMINTSRSMRCYAKGATNSPLAQFSCFAENQNDTGDGGGIPVFTFWPISHFEKVAKDLVQMFILEIKLKRLLMIEFLSLGNQKCSESKRLSWPDEFYPGELNDMNTCNLDEACEPFFPSRPKYKVETSLVQPRQQYDRDVLQVYLTTWIAEVNIDRSRSRNECHTFLKPFLCGDATKFVPQEGFIFSISQTHLFWSFRHKENHGNRFGGNCQPVGVHGYFLLGKYLHRCFISLYIVHTL